MLNDPSGIEQGSGKFFVFDLEATSRNPDLFDIVSAIIIELSLNIIENDHASRKTIILEEAIDFLKGKDTAEGEAGLSDMADFVGSMYRKIRKRSDFAGDSGCLLSEVHP